MSAGLVILIVALVILLACLTVWLGRRAATQRQLRRERLAERAGGHRREAAVHEAKAGQLSEEQRAKEAEAAEQAEVAERHARLARQHEKRAAALADESQEAGERLSREDERARRHGGKADEIEEDL